MAGETNPADPTSTAPAEAGAPATQTPVANPQGPGQRTLTKAAAKTLPQTVAATAVNPPAAGMNVGDAAPHNVYGITATDGSVRLVGKDGRKPPSPGSAGVILAQAGDPITAGTLAALDAAKANGKALDEAAKARRS